MPQPLFIQIDNNFLEILPQKLAELNKDDLVSLTIKETLCPQTVRVLQTQLQNRLVRHLTLFVNADLLDSESFRVFIQQFPRRALRYIQLVFPEQELNSSETTERIIQILIEKIAKFVDFPLLLSSPLQFNDLYSAPHDWSKSKGMKQFLEMVIQNIRRRHTNMTSESVQSYTWVDLQDDSPPISLKSLLKRSKNSELQAAEGLTIEVQHTEETQAEVAIQEETEIEITQQAQNIYKGPLKSISHFIENLKGPHVDKLRFEFSAYYHSLNVTYFSPSAERAYTRIVHQLNSFNLDNLPHGFLLKQSTETLGRARQKIALVLDYDIGYERKTNPYTPICELFDHEPQYYHVDDQLNGILDKFKPARPISNDSFKNWLKNNTYKLTNLWIRYGDAGLFRFLEICLHFMHLSREVDKGFCLGYYFDGFLQLDHLMEKDRLYKCMNRIAEYDSTQIYLLNGLLYTSRKITHDLEKTLDTFDAFWRDVDPLCEHRFKERFQDPLFSVRTSATSKVTKATQIELVIENKRLVCRFLDDSQKNRPILEVSFPTEFTTSELEDLNDETKRIILQHISRYGIVLPFPNRVEDGSRDPNNFIPTTTQPQVYLERLYCILKNARNLNEQIQYLEGINLDAYGSYFASKYEDFKMLHAEMQLSPDGVHAQWGSELFSTRQFLLDQPDLPAYGKKCTLEPVYYYILRFIGQQTEGIQYQDFLNQIDQERFQTQIDGKSWRDWVLREESYEYNWRPPNPDDQKICQENIQKLHPRYREAVHASLFFITNDRYDKTKSLKSLIQCLELVARKGYKNEFYSSLLRFLRHLAYTGAPLNNVEGEMLCNMINSMPDKSASLKDLEQLFGYLGKNHQTTSRWLACRRHNSIPDTHPITQALKWMQSWSTDSLILTTWPHACLAFAERLNFNGRMDELEEQKVKDHLSEAANSPSSNLSVAVNMIMEAGDLIPCAVFNKAMTEIKALPPLDPNPIKGVLQKNGIVLTRASKTIISSNNTNLRKEMVEIIIFLKELRGLSSSENRSEETRALDNKNIQDLQLLIQEHQSQLGFVVSGMISVLFSRLIKNMRDDILHQTLHLPEELMEVIKTYPTFAKANDFPDLDLIQIEAKRLAPFLQHCAKTPSDWAKAFASHIVSFEYETFYPLMNFIDRLSQEQLFVFTLLSELKSKNSKQFEALLEQVNELKDQSFFDTEIAQYICHSGHFFHSKLKDLLVKRRKKDLEDPIVHLILKKTSAHLFPYAVQLLTLTEAAPNKIQIANFFSALDKGMVDRVTKTSASIWMLLAKAHSAHFSSQKPLSVLEWNTLIDHLEKLLPQHFRSLELFYECSTPSLPCLFQVLNTREPADDFTSCLTKLEMAPFGARDDLLHFDLSQVERVINQSWDLSNETPYSFERRLAVMEAFLFVNALGHVLPVFENKPAKELRNEQICTAFHQIKNGTFSSQLSPLQTDFFALALIREAMYRSTGQFPYSTQIISILSLLWDPKHVISNIDTGQGKSLIDVMKAAFLWLKSTRVDVSTSSIQDAKRDLSNFAAFIKFLNIPYSTTPITSNSEFKDFQLNGINFSTFAQLSLFFSKALAHGHQLENPEDSVSFIINESDYSLLDDSTIYRFASSDSNPVGACGDWIYEQINDFVLNDPMFQNPNSEKQDVDALRKHLRAYAIDKKKSTQLVARLTHDQLLIWIESALLVNYKLKEKEDYIIPEEQEIIVIHGKSYHSHVVKLLMQEANIKSKVSPDSKFGNGIQQLLYASLNLKYPNKRFVIPPENKTILSSNNKNLMNYYLRKNGFIWGTSGTVGSRKELLELTEKYGLVFSKIEPHQKKQVKLHPIRYFQNQQDQFEYLIDQLSSVKPDPQKPPHIVFCKDIKTAEILFEKLKVAMNNPPNLQIYNGHGQEESVVQQAAQGGMITVTTPAIGRNTDILYNKAVGMEVWHTAVNTWRIQEQASGRTGRQGSKGEVHFLFNRSEINHKQIDQLQIDIEERSSEERRYKEPIYDILDYLRRFVESIPEQEFESADLALQEPKKSESKAPPEKTEFNRFMKPKAQFIREKWSKFSNECEKMYRQFRMNERYSEESFVKSTLLSFKNILPNTASAQIPTAQEVIEFIHRKFKGSSKYICSPLPVQLSDCLPPIELSYRLHQLGTDSLDSTQQDEIRKRVNLLLKGVKKDDAPAQLAEYLRYLSTSPTTQAQICDIHKACINEFLLKKTQDHWTERWFNCQSLLAKTITTPGYLLLFNAFTTLSPQSSIVEFDSVKAAITKLLRGYIHHSWWYISTDRVKRATSLIESIQGLSTLDELIELLNNQQVELAQADIECNKGRRIKSLHFFGESRLQNVLSQALDLSTVLSTKIHNDSLAQLTQHRVHAITHQPTEQVENLTYDQLQLSRQSPSGKDKENLAVLNTVIEAGIQRKRWSMFKEPVHPTPTASDLVSPDFQK